MIGVQSIGFSQLRKTGFGSHQVGIRDAVLARDSPRFVGTLTLEEMSERSVFPPAMRTDRRFVHAPDLVLLNVG